MSGVKVSDWVVCRAMPDGPVGLVKRVAKDGSWADVDWRMHVKRMRCEHLIVKTSIEMNVAGTRVVVEDCTRKAEIEASS